MGLSLSTDVSLRTYRGKHFAYDRSNHELYELDVDSFDLLTNLSTRTLDSLTVPQVAFANQCLDARLLKISHSPARCYQNLEFCIDDAPLYLLLHITERCNLSCKHCYLGLKSETELSLEQLRSAITEFEVLGGLTVLVSGGEPLLHQSFWSINDIIAQSTLRFELLTNGTLLDYESAHRLQFHEVQISIDGWRTSHDGLRGAGNFDRSMAAIKELLDAGIRVSVATMITRYNTFDIHEFERLEHFCLSHNIVNWSVNVPCQKGDWEKNKEAEIAEAANAIEIVARFGYGEGQHDLGLKHACGGNLCTVMADGNVIGCVLSDDPPFGSLSKGLEASWRLRKPFLLEDTECVTCGHLQLCQGGCRISALETTGSIRGKDLIQCSAIERYLATNQQGRR